MFARGVMSREIMKLKKKLEAGDHDAVLTFWNKIEEKGAPIIEEIDGDTENNLVTFVYKGNDETKNVLLFITYEYENCSDYKLDEYKFERLLDTNIWYKTCKQRNDIHFNYSFSVNDSLDDNWNERWKNLEQDSLNKNKLTLMGENGEGDVITYIVMPKAGAHTWIKKRNNNLQGNMELHQFKSTKLNNERCIWVYTPEGYSMENEPYGFLVLTDGQDYLDISAKNVLDNLISDKKIPPIITVFIESLLDKRWDELQCNDDYAYFIGNEVVPWMKQNYNISDNPEKNIIGGLSLGGLTASFIGLKYSHVFGNVLSQSGSYWYKWKERNDPGKRNWMAKQYSINDKLNLKFYLNIGILDDKEMRDTNIEMRDTLLKKNYDVFYEEFKSGHDYLCWGETLANGLIALIGK